MFFFRVGFSAWDSRSHPWCRRRKRATLPERCSTAQKMACNQPPVNVRAGENNLLQRQHYLGCERKILAENIPSASLQNVIKKSGKATPFDDLWNCQRTVRDLGRQVFQNRARKGRLDADCEVGAECPSR